MEQLEKVKKKRRTHRGTATRLLNKVESLVKEDNVDRIKLKQCSIDLSEKQKILKEIDATIIEMMIENDYKEEDCDKEAEEASIMGERITYNLVLLENALNEVKKDVPAPQSGNEKEDQATPSTDMESTNRRESIASAQSSSQLSASFARRVKLPKLELKRFAGKVSEWQEFWDGYKSAVHDDPSLAKVDKFKYLRSYLDEPAKSVVTGFSLTEADYDAAVELLTKRYAKPGAIKRAHINQLLSLAPVFKETSVERLRNLRDQIETHFRALEAQSVDKESYSTVVVPLLMDKIPQSIRHNMIRFGEDHMKWNVDDLVKSLDKELDVLEGHIPILKSQDAQGRQTERYLSQRPRPTTATALLSTGGKEMKKCPFCSQDHAAENCDVVEDRTERKKLLFKSARCFSCLRPGHRSSQCRFKAQCKLCKGKGHHIAICSSFAQPKETRPEPSATQLDPTASAWIGYTGLGTSVALQTALANVCSKEGRKVRVLFDTGSHKTFITAKTVGKLGLETVRRERLGIKAFGRKTAEIEMREVVELSLKDLNGMGKEVRIEAFVVDTIADIANIHIEVIKEQYPYLKDLYFSDISKAEDTLEVDCLIGSDFYWSFQSGEVRRGNPGEPVAVKTSIGWVLSGPIKGKSLNSVTSCNVNFLTDSTALLTKTDNTDLRTQVDKLWDLDSIGIRVDNEVYTSVIDNILFTGKRYSVGLPWKVAHKPLPSNYSNSLARLKGLMRRLKETPEVLLQYDEVISQQIKEGIVEQVTALEPVGRVHYLPHRAVIREGAETTKLRVVCDASCKDGKTGVSLNSCLHVGPPMTPMIFDVLLRFRANHVALVGDIEKAFLNIEIHPEDRDSLRFLWVNDVKSPEPEVTILRFKRVVFGCNSSPFLLNAVLRHHINKYVEEDPELVRKLIGGFFVDDLVTGGKDVKGTLLLYKKAKETMKAGGFSLRKWKTHNAELAREIDRLENAEGRERENDPGSNVSYAKETLGASIGPAEDRGKVLGLNWNYKEDTLELDLENVGKNIDNKIMPTKRSILSTLASLFDPLGLICPVGVSARIMFQELCLGKVEWDEPLTFEKHKEWEEWLKDLTKVKEISIPRCMFEGNAGEILNCQLHGFADASKRAYCAMVFLVCTTTEGIYTRLLCAKSRVAPLKELTIPRLELMSARILATMMDTVNKALQSEVKIDKVRYWLDSKTTLYWIANNGEWKQFVQHRVNEILLLSRKEDWGHVAGAENPADLGSRGVSATQLRESVLWWEGPKWLKKGEDMWPNGAKLESSEEVKSERKRLNVMVAIAKGPRGVSNIIDISRFSNLGKLLRVTTFVLRFIENLKCKRQGRQLVTRRIKVEEIEAAELIWIKDSQLKLQSAPSFKKMSQNLNVIRENEILICKGRLGNADLDFRSKFPILLPNKDKFTELVIADCHSRVHHCREKATLAELRSKFWVAKGRQCVKRVIKACLICKRLEGKAYDSPPSATLPEFRVKESPLFSKVGVDFAGPLYVKGPGGEVTKCYIALFTCCITRAVHLELVQNLLATTFVNCLKRMCARRGTPSLIISDNAKTFKATVKLLERLGNEEAVVDFLNSRRITWRFNLERAPWQGGIFERMIGTVKKCLRKVLGNARLSYDELNTLLTEIECTVNSRPLTYQYNDPDEVLTPSHLIHGRRLSPLSDSFHLDSDTDLDNSDILSKRFRYLSRKLQHFWGRWRKEYLVDLRESHRMNKGMPVNIEKGDVVIIQEDNTKRGTWKTGIVEETIIGKDGQVRGAKVRRNGRGKFEILTRPLQRLFPLEISARDERKENNSVSRMEEVREETDDNENEKGRKQKDELGKLNRPHRAAASNARILSKLMLDP